MIGTLVDSNVLLDLFTADPIWLEWSSHAIRLSSNNGPLFINPIIYAEVSVRFENIELVEFAIKSETFIRLDLPYEAAFVAGKAHERYRRSGGTRISTLPDFFVGAHAQVNSLTILTRDATRYRTYFPNVSILAPEQQTP